MYEIWDDDENGSEMRDYGSLADFFYALLRDILHFSFGNGVLGFSYMTDMTFSSYFFIILASIMFSKWFFGLFDLQNSSRWFEHHAIFPLKPS